MSSRGPSCKKDPLFKLTASLHMPPDIWCPRHTDRPITAEATSRTGLVVAALQELMMGLGWQDAGMVAGLLIDFVNHMPDDVRRNIAAGIISGQSLIIRRNEEKDEIEVDMQQEYTPLAGPQGERRTRSGLILPGG